MFSDKLPDWVNTSSSRVGAGLGTIARLAASGDPIYGSKLTFAEAERRYACYWRPYHEALNRLIEDIHARFGYCLVIDCHSMPSNAQARRGGGQHAEFVLGDLHGVSCSPRVTRMVEAAIGGGNYLVRRNDPYAGGYITRHYGRPADDIHVLQVEIARALYMDETTFEKTPGFHVLQKRMAQLVAAIAAQVHDLIG
jgi:N-formylglutamate deformylase